MPGIGTRALAIALFIAAVLGGLHAWGIGLWLLGAAAVVFAFVAHVLPWVGVRWLDAAILAVRGLLWRREQGRFHSFGGVPMQVEDDGRHVWIDADSLKRLLRRDEPDDVLAARITGALPNTVRRDPEAGLKLRADGVVRYLATMPGRTDPRLQRLRRYLEREVLFPAAERRRRA